MYGNSLYYLDYYFLVLGWKISWFNVIVVRVVYNGIFVRGGVLYDFYNIYDFFNFRFGFLNLFEF